MSDRILQSEAAQVDIQKFLEDDQRNTSHPVRKNIPTVQDAGIAFIESTYQKVSVSTNMASGFRYSHTQNQFNSRWIFCSNFVSLFSVRWVPFRIGQELLVE